MMLIKQLRRTAIAGAVAVALAGLANIGLAQPKPPTNPPPAAGPAPRMDRGKGVVESPVKNVIAASTAPADFVNPKVEPGLVHWHPNFDTACAAAKKSGKPVLLFHMMGKLDDQFC